MLSINKNSVLSRVIDETWEHLTKNSKDPVKVQIIADIFQETLANHLLEHDLNITKSLLKWVFFYSACLGVDKKIWNPWDCINKTLFKETAAKMATPLNAFFEQMTSKMGELRDKTKSESSCEKVSVVVVTTLSCGGRGHFSPAIAITEFLKERGMTVKMLDNVDGEPCSLERTPENNDDRFSRLRNKIGRLNPSLIILSICHNNEDLGLAYDLNIPIVQIQTDFSISRHITRISTPFETSQERAQFFEMASPKLFKQLILGDIDSAGRRINDTIGSRYSELVANYTFPTRQAFTRLNDAESIAKVRSELGIQRFEQVVIFSSGAVEGKKIDTLIPMLKEANIKFTNSLYVVVICGTDKSLYSNIDAYLKTGSFNHQIRFKLEGNLDENMMAKYAQAASLCNYPYHGCMIGKAGGCTTTENLITGLYTLALPEGGCIEESANRIFLEENQLGKTINTCNDLIPYLFEVLNTHHFPPQVPKNWKDRFSEIIDHKTSL